MPNLTCSQDVKIMLQETAWLEPEHFLLARKISFLEKTNHQNIWQIYLNTLALLGLEVWLQKRLRNKVITRDISRISTAGNLKVDEFKFCTIATENLLSEVIKISKINVAHFYVLIEVLEEEEQVVIKGFLSHNQLIKSRNNSKLPISDGFYQIPLSLFDMEPNHLPLYQRYVEPSEFAPPIVDSQVTQISEVIQNIISRTNTKLSKWLEGLVDENWQNLDSIQKAELNLEFSIRKINEHNKKFKIIDFEINSEIRKVALIIGISTDSEDKKNKIKVLAQLIPINGDNFLPHNIKLALISKAGKVLQTITSRIQDNCIQLNNFKGEVGKKFSIKVSLENSSITEHFEF